MKHKLLLIIALTLLPVCGDAEKVRAETNPPVKTGIEREPVAGARAETRTAKPAEKANEDITPPDETPPFPREEHRRLAEVYAIKGDFEAAIFEYKTIIEAGEATGETYFSIANIELKRGDYDGARRLFLKAIKEDPNKADFHNNLAWAYMEMGNSEAAIMSVTKALVLATVPEASGSSNIHIYLDTKGVIELRSGEFTKAEETLKIALDEAPYNDVTALHHILTHLNQLYESSGDYKSSAAIERKLRNLEQKR